MNDLGGWRAYVVARAAIAIGAILCLGVMHLVWALVTEPASCDAARLPDGSVVYPQCMASMPPDALSVVVGIAGALIGYAIYRRAKTNSLLQGAP